MYVCMCSLYMCMRSTWWCLLGWVHIYIHTDLNTMCSEVSSCVCEIKDID